MLMIISDVPTYIILHILILLAGRAATIISIIYVMVSRNKKKNLPDTLNSPTNYGVLLCRAMPQQESWLTDWVFERALQFFFGNSPLSLTADIYVFNACEISNWKDSKVSTWNGEEEKKENTEKALLSVN